MTQQISGLYRALRGLFGARPFSARRGGQRGREFRRLPTTLGELDESYRNLLRELSKR